MALLAAGCGGGSSPAPEPIPSPPPPPSVPTTGNTVERVKAAMTGSHEATSPALTSGNFYLGAPTVERTTAPGGAVALGGWGQVMAATGNTATNARVQLRNFETFAHNGSGWTRVQFGHGVTGAMYPANYAGSASQATDLKPEASGGVSIRPGANTIFRFWPESGVTKSLVATPGAITSVFTTVQARLVAASTGTDDTASAQYLVNTGADWWTSVEQASPYASAAAYRAAIPTNATTMRIGAGKQQLVTTTWQAMNFHSGSNAQADALASTGAGGRPLTNSEALEPRAVTRILPVGDSITQGSEPGVVGGNAQTSPGNDSYRRLLWNALVSDSTLPIVSFVGTRTGTVTSSGDCGRTDATVPADGTYLTPEFEPSHEAYWGLCTNQFVNFLPARLSTLASSARMATPDVALIHLGSNDINLEAQAAAGIVGELSGVVDALRAVNGSMQIGLARLIPLAGKTTEINALNAALDANGAAFAADGVTLVDQNGGFTTSSDTWDGIHPTTTGEAKMAAKWLTAVKAMLP